MHMKFLNCTQEVYYQNKQNPIINFYVLLTAHLCIIF